MKRVILLILLFCLVSSPCFATKLAPLFLTGQAKKEVKKGNRFYRQEKFPEALNNYEKAFLDDPDSDIVNFDLGAGLYKTEDYKGAISHFEQSLVSDDESLEQKASYNVANAKYKYGIGKEDTELEAAIALLKESLRHYEHAIELDFEDEDAKYNYEFVKKELKRLEKKLEQKQQKQEQQKQQSQGKDKQEQDQPSSAKATEDRQQKQQQAQQDQSKQEQEQQKQKQQQQQQNARQEQKESEQTKGFDQSSKMSEDEALMLLEGYRQEEEPKGLYKEKMPQAGLSEAVKDW